jgi:ABC-type cobalamin/Fe3+-siderophores transport system ATPase subunit
VEGGRAGWFWRRFEGDNRFLATSPFLTPAPTLRDCSSVKQYNRLDIFISSRNKKGGTRMRLVSICATDLMPIKRFEVAELSDVVVLAGPNGIGKTRFIQQLVNHLQAGGVNPKFRVVLQPTSIEERNQWGNAAVDTSTQEGLQKLQKVLHKNRRRGNWRSSILNFESDRSIQNVSAFTFSWEMKDPYEEEMQWNYGFGTMRNRFNDTVHSLFRLIEHQKRQIADEAMALRKAGSNQLDLSKYVDPITPFREIFFQLLGPKEMVDPDPQRQTLEFKHENVVHPITALSSGEREVVNIAFDFLLRRPEDCIVLFDEPELHLHPELSFRLTRVLQGIGARNQFILCTHSPDVITSALDNTVIFVAPPRLGADSKPMNQAITISESDSTNQALKMLGQSVGIISLGKKIVLIEGRSSSLDKQTYGSIIKAQFPRLVLVASGGKHEVRSFATVYDNILSKTLWGVDFYMLCDGDSLPSGIVNSATDGSRRLKKLQRYHLENYFLDENVWARVFADGEPEGSWLRSPDKIREVMKDCAKNSLSYAAAIALSSAVREKIGNVDLMPGDCHGKTAAELAALMKAKAEAEFRRVETGIDLPNLEASARQLFDRLQGVLGQDTTEWQTAVPGKPILSAFCQRASIPQGRAKTLYIKQVQESNATVFDEIIDLFRLFDTDQ